MRAEEIEHREVGRGFADSGAQPVRIEPCNSEETLRAHCVRKDPGERPTGDPGRVLNRIFMLLKNCQPSVKQIMSRKAFVGTEASGAQ